MDEKPIEIQIRTHLQHLWAELSERLSDIFRPIKYGGGPTQIRNTLDSFSLQVARYESLEMQLLSVPSLTAQEEIDRLASIKVDMEGLKVDIENELKDLIKVLEDIGN